jgi:hypothetical protein
VKEAQAANIKLLEVLKEADKKMVAANIKWQQENTETAKRAAIETGKEYTKLKKEWNEDNVRISHMIMSKPAAPTATPTAAPTDPLQVSCMALDPAARTEWKELSGIAQTDVMYDREIVKRMGVDFYNNTFLPKIKELISKGAKYQDFRDSVREELGPWSTTNAEQVRDTTPQGTASGDSFRFPV